MKQPAFQFYPGDWMRDAAVSLCAPATRGVWIDLICAMHDLGRLGELCGTPDQLARTARCSTADLALAIADLQATGAADVTERNGKITVINRRMKREAKTHKLDAKRAKEYRERQAAEAASRLHHGEIPPSSSSSSNPPIVPQRNFKSERAALLDAFGIETPSQRDDNAMYEAWVELKAKGATAADAKARYALYLEQFPGYPPTPNAILKHWHILKPKRKKAALPPDDYTLDSFQPEAANG